MKTLREILEEEVTQLVLPKTETNLKIEKKSFSISKVDGNGFPIPIIRNLKLVKSIKNMAIYEMVLNSHIFSMKIL